MVDRVEWLAKFGWAPGDYWGKCSNCGDRNWFGAKRSWRCQPCAMLAANEAPCPEADVMEAG